MKRVKVLFSLWILYSFTLLGFSLESFMHGTGASPVSVGDAIWEGGNDPEKRRH